MIIKKLTPLLYVEAFLLKSQDLLLYLPLSTNILYFYFVYDDRYCDKLGE